MPRWGYDAWRQQLDAKRKDRSRLRQLLFKKRFPFTPIVHVQPDWDAPTTAAHFDYANRYGEALLRISYNELTNTTATTSATTATTTTVNWTPNAGNAYVGWGANWHYAIDRPFAIDQPTTNFGVPRWPIGPLEAPKKDQRERQLAVRRGRKLLMRLLDEQQLRDYAASGMFLVASPDGREFIIRKNETVVELKDGMAVASHCIHLPHRYIAEDTLIGLKLLLENDVDHFEETANKTSYAEPKQLVVVAQRMPSVQEAIAA